MIFSGNYMNRAADRMKQEFYNDLLLDPICEPKRYFTKR
jgi:hypothetical protein